MPKLVLFEVFLKHSSKWNLHFIWVYHSQITSYKSKLVNPQRLGEDISTLLLCGNKLHFDIFLLNMVSYEMMSDINVLCPSVLNRILG